MNHRYFVADHQTGDTAHYPSAAQAVAAGRALALAKINAQGLTGLHEKQHQDGCLYLGVADAANTGFYLGALVSVGKLNS